MRAPPTILFGIRHRFGDATQVAYGFWLYELCDVYLELIKPVVGDMSDGNKKVSSDVIACQDMSRPCRVMSCHVK